MKVVLVMFLVRVDVISSAAFMRVFDVVKVGIVRYLCLMNTVLAMGPIFVSLIHAFVNL